ncbi:MAG: cupin domain-containing protein [Thalassobaculaceae bacterium]|nr:cupin domain-containing protein [Thalassobaculaceae bacterium]
MVRLSRAVLAASLLLVGLPALAHDTATAPASPRNALPPELLQSVDLGKEIPGMEGRTLRMRKVTMLPGGALPLHSHTDRPAIVYVLEGRVREHYPADKAPIVYGAGDVRTEQAGVDHWIENIGDTPVVGVVVDIVNDGTAPAFTTEEVRRRYGLGD